MSLPEGGAGAAFWGAFAGRRAFVTGHTGFKGSWLCEWLLALGADVVGYSLEPPTEPSHFEATGLARRMTSIIGDVRDKAALGGAVATHAPELVFHLAAQPLVRCSYEDPVGTYETNVMGTVNLLEAARAVESVRVLIVITSDKCYDNKEWPFAYRENDPMGGSDPYSSSKGCAELVCEAYHRSFFTRGGRRVRMATARAGNVIGGGDWAADRLLPDCVRALAQGEPVVVRNPDSVRPWQHVLEPLAGYLLLAAKLWGGDPGAEGAWNFGPLAAGNLTVREVVALALEGWGGGEWRTAADGDAGPPESVLLKLDCTKAHSLLGWRPLYDTKEAVAAAVTWYRGHFFGVDDPAGMTRADIAAYMDRAAREGASWMPAMG